MGIQSLNVCLLGSWTTVADQKLLKEINMGDMCASNGTDIITISDCAAVEILSSQQIDKSEEIEERFSTVPVPFLGFLEPIIIGNPASPNRKANPWPSGPVPPIIPMISFESITVSDCEI